MTDKEIALELTKAYIQHLNARATSVNINSSHLDGKNIPGMYKLFYKSVVDCEKPSDNE